MSDLNLTSFNPLYPMRIHPYKELLNDSNVNIMDKVNAVIDYLNQVGKLTNDVVKDWNTVYQWVMNDGLTTDVNNKLEAMLANHEFDPIMNNILTKIGDLTTLQTVDKDTLVHAINDLVTEIGSLSSLQTSDKSSIVNAINANVASLAQIASLVTSSGAKTDGSDCTTAFNNSFSNSSVVRVPFGAFTVNGTVTIPDGAIFIIDGTLTGTGKIICSGSVQIYGNGKISLNTPGGYSLTVQSGKIDVKGLFFKDTPGVTASLGIIPTAQIDRIRIKDCTFTNTGYGILKQGGGSNNFTVYNAILSGNIFDGNKGDAIEWNVAQTDRRLIIEKNIVNNINGSSQWWGIGIGVAGGTYGSSTRLKEFVIRGNVLSNVRQAIHVEACDEFVIENNRITSVTDAFSTSSGLNVSGIQIYGSNQFIIRNNELRNFTNAVGISVLSGAVSGTYQEACKNYTIENNELYNAGNIESYGAGTDVYAKLKKNTLVNGQLKHWGALNLQITDNDISDNVNLDAVGLVLDYVSSNGNVVNFNTSNNRRIAIKNNHVRDMSGYAGVTITNLTADFFDASNNNFEIPDLTNSGKQIVQRTFYTDSTAFPYGIEFLKGDLVISKANGSRWLVTASGSLNQSTDNFAIESGYTDTIYSTNYAWNTGKGYHEAGQRITLSNIGTAGASFNAKVKNVYVAGGHYRIQLDRPWITSASGSITATNTATYVAV